jgi:hypothetical protein
MFEQWQPWWDVVLLLTVTGLFSLVYAFTNDGEL